MPSAERNIGVRNGMPTRSGMPTRASAVSVGPSPGPSGDATLQEMFATLQLSIVGQLQEQRRDDEARRREKGAEDRRTQAALEARMSSMEEQIQVVTALFRNGRGSVGGGPGPRGGVENGVVNSVPNHFPAAQWSKIEKTCPKPQDDL